ncbi:hypothetical protein FA95DRAFT_848719 [Auriscalpium vulgare]|uniref:Uncharacterized protein n=1 Tax=Auriscalpium vulgare TaxID=40419 RepID=A0ACB8S0L8_9AGAM|nr:hypothetical protein FA95DRAFT_848719 [Auriscalpium vulgare]
MCYAYGSIEQATSVCPMCKVFKPSGARCPHKQDVCKNSALHPRHDVVHMKNAEVQTFNGCGFCKWARTSPPAKQAGYQNPGWPGCCRTPTPSETRFIPPADWNAVATVHHIPIPNDVKALLESINTTAASRGSPSFGHSALTGKAAAPLAAVPPPALDRRTSSGTTPSRAGTTPRTQPLAIPSRARSGGSPKEAATTLASATPRGAGLRESPPTSTPSVLESSPTHLRKTSVEHGEKRGDSPSTPSPLRRNIELEATAFPRGSVRRPSVSRMPVQASKASPESPPALRRRASTTDTSSLANASNHPPRSIERRDTISASRPTAKRASLDIDLSAMSLSGHVKSPSSGSSDSGESLSRSGSEGTVTSDGGFTDYLSDESEAELQKQAEAKAALLAQNQMEEQEFKLARQQLAHVDLRPPKSWNNSTAPSTPPRSHASAVQSYSGALPTPPYTPQTRGQVDVGVYGRSR